jgi:hypothetical protein
MSDIYYETFLPNFKYKKGKISFIFKQPLKLDIMKKIVWMNESEINNINIFDSVLYDYENISYKIIEEPFNEGLKVNIYQKHYDISHEIHHILQYIEANILNINIDKIVKQEELNKKSNNNNFMIYDKRSSPSNNKQNNYDDYHDIDDDDDDEFVIYSNRKSPSNIKHSYYDDNYDDEYY